jgi:hypothetical protein
MNRNLDDAWREGHVLLGPSGAAQSITRRKSRCINLTDHTGKPLDGASVYTVPFEKGAMPPAKAFWSVTLYDNEGDV